MAQIQVKLSDLVSFLSTPKGAKLGIDPSTVSEDVGKFKEARKAYLASLASAGEGGGERGKNQATVIAVAEGQGTVMGSRTVANGIVEKDFARQVLAARAEEWEQEGPVSFLVAIESGDSVTFQGCGTLAELLAVLGVVGPS